LKEPDRLSFKNFCQTSSVAERLRRELEALEADPSIEIDESVRTMVARLEDDRPAISRRLS
jgi:hypothetical protein